MKKTKQLAGIIFTVLIFTVLFSINAFATDSGSHTSTILFTHDMHAHFLPTTDVNGEETGGFARLATLLEEQRTLHPDAITVDGGDFSMGSLFQSIYATEAPELRIMGAMGYDATTFGNHEYDFRETGFASMLESAVNSGEALPYILEANYLPPTPDSDEYDVADDIVWNAFENYGVADYVLMERGGITYGIFGVMGEESDADAPESGMILHDPVETAKRVVSEIKAAADPAKPLFIVCLSHSGTNEDSSKSEDELLAQKVDEIDVIISGHSHTVLTQPLVVNDTLIVSCGCYTANLGVLNVSWDDSHHKTVTSYELIPVDGSVAESAGIAEKIDEFKTKVVENYLSHFGYTDFDQVIGTNSIAFDTVDEVYAEHRESGLGDLLADAYFSAAQSATKADEPPVTLALTATGVIRDTISTGDITVSDAFNVSSLGVGTDGLAGYPLVTAYLTGKEIRAICEVDASVTPLMPAAQLHMSGIGFTWNDHRLIFNKVTSCYIMNQDGTTEKLVDDQLYRVVTGLYCAQMLSAVKTQSFGILSIVPKNADGTPVTNFDDCIIYDANGNEVKEWYALATYISANQGGTISSFYSAENRIDRKIEQDNAGLWARISHPNRITFALICIALALILVIVALLKRLISRVMYERRHARRERMIARREGTDGGTAPSVERTKRKKGERRTKQWRRRYTRSNSDYGRFYYVADDDSFDGSDVLEPVDEFMGFVKKDDSDAP